MTTSPRAPTLRERLRGWGNAVVDCTESALGAVPQPTALYWRKLSARAVPGLQEAAKGSDIPKTAVSEFLRDPSGEPSVYRIPFDLIPYAAVAFTGSLFKNGKGVGYVVFTAVDLIRAGVVLKQEDGKTAFTAFNKRHYVMLGLTEDAAATVLAVALQRWSRSGFLHVGNFEPKALKGHAKTLTGLGLLPEHEWESAKGKGWIL